MKRTTRTALKTAPRARKAAPAAGQHAKYIYVFGGGRADGRSAMKYVLGGKGANLGEMTNLGVPVPPGFTITTEVCRTFYELNRRWPAGLESELAAKVT